MKRRNFLQTASALSLPAIFKGIPVSALPFFDPLAALQANNDRILVLVQLLGGNDGLNMLIPLDKYDLLQQMRGDIMIPEQDLLTLQDTAALHPLMGGVQHIYNEGKVSFVQNVGYPNQNRSHFRSQDIWASASAADEQISSGWLGRYLQEEAPGFPEGYPNESAPDPFAIVIGRTTAATCQGEINNFSMAITDPFGLATIDAGVSDTNSDSYYGRQLTFVKNAIKQNNLYGAVIRTAAEKGNNLSPLYSEENELAQHLKIVAQLISGGLQTKVYVVRLGGFDTHGDQVANNEPKAGRHAVLLDTLSAAIAAFQDDLQRLGLEERVLGMTFSEFGRQVRSNGSLGTDHGDAAPLMLFGHCVQSGLFGESPDIDTAMEEKAGVGMKIDFRNVYGSVFQDWFGLEADRIQQLLFPEYTYLPLLSNCSLATSTEEYQLTESILLFPQPAQDYLKVRFEVSRHGNGMLKIMDINGRIVQHSRLQHLARGQQEVQLNVNHLPSGMYFLQVELGPGKTTHRFIKQ